MTGVLYTFRVTSGAQGIMLGDIPDFATLARPGLVALINTNGYSPSYTGHLKSSWRRAGPTASTFGIRLA